jgi:hypothetical protein
VAILFDQYWLRNRRSCAFLRKIRSLSSSGAGTPERLAGTLVAVPALCPPPELSDVLAARG